MDFLTIQVFAILLKEYPGHPLLYPLHFVCSYLLKLKRNPSLMKVLKIKPTVEDLKYSLYFKSFSNDEKFKTICKNVDFIEFLYGTVGIIRCWENENTEHLYLISTYWLPKVYMQHKKILLFNENFCCRYHYFNVDKQTDRILYDYFNIYLYDSQVVKKIVFI